jgi:hypothetical protein
MNHDPSRAIVLSCNPRGGSTWLLDLLGRLPGTAPLWEPLYLRPAPAFRRLGFGWQQHIPEDADWPEARRVFERLLRGKMLTAWICSHTTLQAIRDADRFIVKFCRAHALLPWLTRQFTFELRPVYLARHPFAVVASQLRHGAWDHLDASFDMPDGPYSEFYTGHRAFLESLSTREEVLTAHWALGNRVPLTHPDRDRRWTTVHYEHLLTEPLREVERIFGAWGMAAPPGVAESAGAASATTRGGHDPADAGRQLGRWREAFSEAQLRRMLRVLEHFGIGCYGAEDLPRS